MKMNAKGILKYGMVVSSCGVLLSADAIADGDSATAWSEKAMSVDTRLGEVRTIAPADIGYSPSWVDASSVGAHVVLLMVEHAETSNAVTNEVEMFEADAEGNFKYEIGEGDARCVRLIHRVCDANDVTIGVPLVRDIAFGVATGVGGTAAVDCRTNSLELAVAAGAVNLAYDTDWATNASSLAISAVRLAEKGGSPVSTNEFFTVEADDSSATRLCGVGMGCWRLLCRIADAAGNALLEYETAEFEKRGGFFLIVR